MLISYQQIRYLQYFFKDINRQAIEFKTKSYNGMMTIPNIYKDWYDNTVSVVLLRESQESQPRRQQAYSTERFFDQFNADLTGYRFNREEANERPR
jgi:uncharacterized protein YhjY with autotransporter beta-barrel domain